LVYLLQWYTCCNGIPVAMVYLLQYSFGIPVAVLRGLITFIQIYIFKLNILDGNRGLLSSIMFAQYTFNKYAALWSLEQERKLKDI
jgi:hypothetical protein